MKDWYAERPDLFVKRAYDHPGCGNSPVFITEVFVALH